MTSWYRRWGKRFFDVLIVSIGILILLPVWIALIIIIWLRIGSPVLFKQLRPGLHGKPFTIYKFRTMTDARDKNGTLLPDADRLTPLGRFLRSTSLDELPELFNVLKGDMSLVGPRPLLMQYLDRYTSEQARRHEVRPGITGWAQINGRNLATWDERLELDLYYLKHCSLPLDVKILSLTLLAVLTRKGLSEVPNGMLRSTMPSLNAESEDN